MRSEQGQRAVQPGCRGHHGSNESKLANRYYMLAEEAWSEVEEEIEKMHPNYTHIHTHVYIYTVSVHLFVEHSVYINTM